MGRISLFVVLLLMGISSKGEALFGQDSSHKVQEKSQKKKREIKELLSLADSLASNKQYLEAYYHYTEAGMEATSKKMLDYASELYIKAIKLKMIHRLDIPLDYPNRNTAYLNLCIGLRKNLSNEAIYWHEEAIRYLEEDKDTLSMVKVYKSYALYYIVKMEESNALSVIERALPISEAFGDTVSHALILLDYADLLNKEGDYQKADSITDVGYTIIQAYEMDHANINAYKWSLFFIELKAFIYFNEGRFEDSEKYFTACIDSIERIKSLGGNAHTDLHYITNIRLGRLYYELKNYREADVLFLQAEGMLNNPENVGFDPVLLYESMIKTYSKAGVYKSAFEASEKYRAHIDSSFQAAEYQKNMVLRDMANLDIDNAEKEITLLKQKAEQAKHETEIVYLSFGIGFVGILVLLMLVLYRNKNKTTRALMDKNTLIVEQQAQIRASIEYAKKIQKAILPSNDLMKICLPTSFVYYKPRDIVSGDFYWVHTIGDKVLLACADSTGHGVPGAIVSMIGNNGLNTCVNEYGLTQPAQILDGLSKFVEETFEKSEDEVNDGMDISLCLFDFAKKEVQFAGANNPLYLVRGNELEIIKADKQPIGRFDYRKPFTNHTISLEGVDNIYLCTDGIQDQFGGAKGKKFKLRRLKRLLVELSAQNLNNQKSMLHESFEDWRDSEDQVDDVCFIGVQVRGLL